MVSSPEASREEGCNATGASRLRFPAMAALVPELGDDADDIVCEGWKIRGSEVRVARELGLCLDGFLCRLVVVEFNCEAGVLRLPIPC